MAFPQTVTVCECWARDGLQSLDRVISTDHKLEMIGRTIAAGFRKLEVTSFSPLPQFGDAAEILRRLPRDNEASFVVLMPNPKGFAAYRELHLEGYGVHEIILMISSSEAHNKVNFRMDHPTAMRAHAAIIEEAKRLGLRVIGCPGTVWGCAIAGDVPISKVKDVTRFYIEAGADTIMLGDTTGAANPLSVRERIGALQASWPAAQFIAHFHDTRGNGIVNSIAALELGLTYVDTSIGAIGGQPATSARKYQHGFTGNTCSEDLVALLTEMGIDTGIDVQALIKAGLRAEEIVGMPLRANVIRSGPVNHEPRPYTPYEETIMATPSV